MTDAPDRHEPPTPMPATVRDGPRAPAHDRPALPATDDLMAAIVQARTLFRVSRSPRADATWPHLRPHLLVAEARLQRRLRERPDDDATAILLQETRRFLGRHP